MSSDVLLIGLSLVGVFFVFTRLRSNIIPQPPLPFSRNGDRNPIRTQDNYRDRNQVIENTSYMEPTAETNRNDPPMPNGDPDDMASVVRQNH